jgi:hypothetical protein
VAFSARHRSAQAQNQSEVLKASSPRGLSAPLIPTPFDAGIKSIVVVKAFSPRGLAAPSIPTPFDAGTKRVISFKDVPAPWIGGSIDPDTVRRGH